MKIKHKALITLLGLSLTFQLYGADITSVNVVNDKKVEILFNENLEIDNPEVDSDIKILKDLAVESFTRDETDNKKIIINLKDNLLENKFYNLIFVFGVEGSINFNTSNVLEGSIIENKDKTDSKQKIERIIITSAKTIDVYFKKELINEEYEVKFFRETNILSKEKTQDKSIDINFNEKLDNYSKYMVMVLSLKDRAGKDIVVNNDIFDFSTPRIMEDSSIENNKIESEFIKKSLQENDIPENHENNETDLPKNEIVDKNNIPLNSAKDNEITVGNSEIEDNSHEGGGIIETIDASGETVNSIALNSASNPKAGTTTGILIFLTLLLSSTIFFRKNNK